ncbi:MAG TPA: hypothetical protein PKD52_02190 [Clostridiales bacterium]|nr:hypothetical protein [Clostridiales bacterium]
MKKRFQFLTLLLIGLICFTLTGCDSFSEEDAITLVEGDLNSIYKNINDEAYLKLCDTTEAERNKLHESSMESAAASFISYFDFDETMMSQETHDRVIGLYQAIYAKAKFEVTTATASDDKYLVSVTIYPMDIFQKVFLEDYDEFYNTYKEKYDAGMSAEELEAYYQNGVLDLCEKRLASLDYLSAVTLSVQVVPQEKDGKVFYSLSESDFSNIDSTIISQDY